MTKETTDKKVFVIEWREGFKVGIAQVDTEHRHLFGLVKNLSLESIQATIEELLDYVVTHFSNEQGLMEESGYPDFRAHLGLHEQFGATVADFLGSGDEWSGERVQELRKFLNKWLIGHIMTHDLRFGRWYQREASLSRKVEGPPAKKPGWFARIFGKPE
jgi:hemerythrin